ncbi:MAG: aspartyl-tRNA amidotransferase [Alicyclobacillus sp. RIFOXYA1_FULL_53_8]|nr:MAG: aspartyl-tRNA amidotransferase [Alicyclobacillus sp. RIFOXYA1_FULL_53_8]
MNLSERLSEDMKQAMKDKDKLRLSVIRMVRAAVKNQEIELGTALADEQVLALVQRELKQRRDSLQAFESAGRTDLMDEVKLEIEVLLTYLPAQLSVDELRELAQDIIRDLGATKKAEMGKVMAQMMPKTRGRADGKLVQEVVQSLLP